VVRLIVTKVLATSRTREFRGCTHRGVNLAGSFKQAEKTRKGERHSAFQNPAEWRKSSADTARRATDDIARQPCGTRRR
jgi:hypothetical protein